MLLCRSIISEELTISVVGVKSKDRKYNARLTKFDWLIELLALSGVFVGFAFIAYGTVSLPAIVPTHIGTQGIDSYGSKWSHLTFLSILMCAFYGGITLVNRYLYLVYRPADSNAPVMFHTYQEVLRVVKFIIVCIQAIFIALYVIAMPRNPGAALGFLGIIIVISMMCIVYPTLFIIVSSTNKFKK